MTDDLRQFLAALGAALVSTFGDTAPAVPVHAPVAPDGDHQPVQVHSESKQDQEKPKKRMGQRPVKDFVCIVCGSGFRSSGVRAMLCSHCRILRVNGNKQFLAAFEAAKKKLAVGGEVPVPAPAPTASDGKIRCERMHATIPATMCGTREECEGKKDGRLCEHLPKKGKAA